MRSWNKKGEDEAQSDSLSSLVKIIIVVLFLVFFFFVGSKLYAAFFGVDKTTMDSFNGLVDNFELMLQRPTNFEQYTTTFVLNDKAVLKAGSCGNTPCICIYKDQAKLAANNPWKCRNFDRKAMGVTSYSNYKEIVFYSLRAKTFNEINPCDISTESSSNEAQQLFSHRGSGIPEEFPLELYPVIYYPFKFPYQECKNNKLYFLYIEKYVHSNGKAFLSLGENLNEDTTGQRVETLSNCPAGSEGDCDTVRRNSKLLDGRFCYYDTRLKTCRIIEGFKKCLENQDVTDDCLCGTQMIFKNSEYKHCTYRDSTKSFYALPFSCKSITCADYCKTKNSDGKCDIFEMEYCDRNICDETQSCKCKSDLKDGYIGCFDFAGPSC